VDEAFEVVSETMREMSEEHQKLLVRRIARKVGLVVQPGAVAGPVTSYDAYPLVGSVSVKVVPVTSECMPSLERVFEKRELLSQVLAFVGEGTEVASMLVCKDLCVFVIKLIIMVHTIGQPRLDIYQCCSTFGPWKSLIFGMSGLVQLLPRMVILRYCSGLGLSQSFVPGISGRVEVLLKMVT
jgi:hypothetical protein